MQAFLYVQFLIIHVYLFLAIYIFLKNPKALLNKLCSLFIIHFFIWSIAEFIANNPEISEKTARLSYNIGSFGWIGFISVYLWMMLAFAEKKQILKNKLLYPVLFIPPVIFIYLQWTNHIITTLVKSEFGWFYVWDLCLVKSFFIGYYILYVGAGLALCRGVMRNTKSLFRKKQAQIIFAASIVPIIIGSITNLVLPSLHTYILPNIGTSIVLIWVLGIVYAMVRYKFLGLTPAIAAEHIVDSMDECMILLNTAGRIVMANSKTLNLLGYGDEELMGKSIQEIVSGVSSGTEDIAQLMLDREFKNYNVFLKTKNGGNVPALFTNSMIKNNNAISGMVCVARDIVDTKNFEKNLAQSLSLLRATLEATTDGILVVNILGKITSYNQRFVEMWGIPKNIMEKEDDAAAIAFVLKQLKYPDIFERKIKEAFAQPESETFDVLEFNDGKIFERYSGPQRIGKEVMGRVWSFRDVTQRVKFENEKEEMKRHLVQVEKMASLGEIAAGIAHEINTPLSVILGYQEHLKKKLGADSSFQEYVTISIEEVEQCRDLINNFLVYARPVDPKIIQEHTTDMNEAIQSALKLFALNKLQNITVNLDLEKGIPLVKGVQKQIMQVFINLINNAVQAMPGGGDLTISTRCIKEKSGSAQKIEFRIADTGCGIPIEHISKVFDPFFTTKRPGKGTGLGLSICFRIMESHQGKLRVESNVSKGTVFIGELPV